jgi:hypothetical protein
VPRFLCSLPNDTHAGGRRPQIITDDPDAIAAFSAKWDVPGRAVYRCVNPLKPGATRRRIETIAAVEQLHADVDVLKDLVETFEEVDTRLLHLPLQPTWVRDSGGGRHVIYELKEPASADDPEYFERAARALKRLTQALSADPAPAHAAALLRELGTHNTKRGDPVLVQTLWGSGEKVDLTDIEAMIDLLPEFGLFQRKPVTNGRADGAPKPAMRGDTNGPVDVDQRLADMTFEGPGVSGVHSTELSCTASLLRQGLSLQSAVLTVLEDTQKAVAGDPRTAGWNWAEEKVRLEGQCFDFIANKHPELSAALPDEFRDAFEAALRSGRRPRFVYRRGTGWHMRALTVVNGGLDGGRAPEGSEEEKAQKDSPDPAAVPHYRFKLVPFSSLKPGPEPLYLVDELIPLTGLVDVWGKAKCFKSFWCLDLMLHVAMGWEYRDRYVHQGAVVYCAFEGAHGYKKRVEALRRHYNIEEDASVPLYVMPGQANLIAEHRLLIADIAAQLGDVKPAAVVLDTLNKSLFGSENKDVDMGAYVRAAEAIRDRFGCVVIIVHHCGYDDTRPRGHSSLPGAVDAQLAVVRSESIITVTVEMMRDGPEDTQVVSAVETIEVGQDQNGKILTSLVVVPSEAESAAVHRDWPRGLNVFDAALKTSTASYGEAFQPEAGVLPVRAVDQNRVRDRFYDTYAEAEEDEKKRQEKIRKAFNRALADAQSRGLIRVRHSAGRTMLWRPGQDG